MAEYTDRLADDLHASLRSALRVLERDIGRVGKPCPNLAEVAAIRSQVMQAAAHVGELYGAMSIMEARRATP